MHCSWTVHRIPLLISFSQREIVQLLVNNRQTKNDTLFLNCSYGRALFTDRKQTGMVWLFITMSQTKTIELSMNCLHVEREVQNKLFTIGRCWAVLVLFTNWGSSQPNYNVRKTITLMNCSQDGVVLELLMKSSSCTVYKPVRKRRCRALHELFTKWLCFEPKRGFEPCAGSKPSIFLKSLFYKKHKGILIQVTDLIFFILDQTQFVKS